MSLLMLFINKMFIFDEIYSNYLKNTRRDDVE